MPCVCCCNCQLKKHLLDVRFEHLSLLQHIVSLYQYQSYKKFFQTLIYCIHLLMRLLSTKNACTLINC
jgi:hypothetical protein